MSKQVTLTVVKVTAPIAKTAIGEVEQYRADGGGSNRTVWANVRTMLGAVLMVIKTGKATHAVEVTDIYRDHVGGKSPAYNLAHRQLSQNTIRPYWHRVGIVAMTGVTVKGAIHTGTPDTTVPMGPGVRLYVTYVK